VRINLYFNTSAFSAHSPNKSAWDGLEALVQGRAAGKRVSVSV
jgi:hypothetical protein